VNGRPERENAPVVAEAVTRAEKEKDAPIIADFARLCQVADERGHILIRIDGAYLLGRKGHVREMKTLAELADALRLVGGDL
jgi:hypothetical protein